MIAGILTTLADRAPPRASASEPRAAVGAARLRLGDARASCTSPSRTDAGVPRVAADARGRPGRARLAGRASPRRRGRDLRERRRGRRRAVVRLDAPRATRGRRRSPRRGGCGASSRGVAPDLVHLHSAKAGLAGRLALRGRLPTVFQPHAWSFEAAGGADRPRRAWRGSGSGPAGPTSIVCVSDDEQRRGERPACAARYEVVPNGVDLTALRAGFRRPTAPRRAPSSAWTPTCRSRCASAGWRARRARTCCWRRGRGCSSACRTPQLVLVGDGPDRESARRRSASPGVRFAGDAEDVAPWLAAANVSVHRLALGGRAVARARWRRWRAARSVVATEVAGMARGARGRLRRRRAGRGRPTRSRTALVERLADLALADREGAAGRGAGRGALRRARVAADGRASAELYEQTLGAAPARRGWRRAACAPAASRSTATSIRAHSARVGWPATISCAAAPARRALLRVREAAQRAPRRPPGSPAGTAAPARSPSSRRTTAPSPVAITGRPASCASNAEVPKPSDFGARRAPGRVSTASASKAASQCDTRGTWPAKCDAVGDARVGGDRRAGDRSRPARSGRPRRPRPASSRAPRAARARGSRRRRP